MEGFAAYRQKALALKLPRPKVVYTAINLHCNTLFRTLAVDWREEGTKILNHQHGGGYGQSLIEPCENYEARVSDHFYTFGWQSQAANVTPLCVPIGSVLPATGSSCRVLLTLTEQPRHIFRITFSGMPDYHESMISQVEKFVYKMRGEQELVVRTNTHDYGWGMVKKLRQVNPNLCLDDMRKSGLDSFSRSFLVVHSYLGTSYLETLALNIPTVCFYSAEIYAFRKSTQPFIDGLAAVGIIHQSGEDAARFVLDVMSDPMT
jgi:putative transferase (TIGR04331 family)